MKRTSWLLGLFLASMPGLCPADLIISDPSPQRNDRYYTGADRAFIADGYDLSGVGKATTSPITNNTAPWSTLISPHYALTANHYGPAVGSTVEFVAGNSPSSPIVSATVAGSTNVGGDLQLIRFTDAVAGVAPFAIVADDQAALNGQQIFVYGQPNLVGTNNIVPNSFGTYSGTGFQPTYAYLYQYDPAVGPNEAMLNDFDSGGPSFVVDATGHLAISGIHTFVYDLTDSTGRVIGSGSGDTYVSHYLPALQNAIAAQNALFGYADTLTITRVRSVPAPGSLALLGVGLGACGLELRRRRSRHGGHPR